MLYRDVDAVAFVSNNRAAAEQVQLSLGRVGITYPDNIDYWRHSVGVPIARSVERLDQLTRVNKLYGADDEQRTLRIIEIEAKLFGPNPNSPFEKLLRENERITILDAVIPRDNWQDCLPPPDGIPVADGGEFASETSASETSASNENASNENASNEKASETSASETSASETPASETPASG